jgi:hypothetical protein
MRARGHLPSAGRRFIAACLLLLCALLGAHPVSAAPLPAPPSAVSEGSDAPYALPPDQPRGKGRPLELPPVPAGFSTSDHGWIHVSYPPSTRERAESLIREADAIRAELAARLGQPVLREVHVRIARTPGDMVALAPEGAPYPKYASGVAYSEIGLVLLTLTPLQPSALHDVTEVFRHELAHLALGDAIGEGHHVPHWLNEGLAVHLSGESSLVRMKTLSTATLAGRLLPLPRLDAGFGGDAIAAELAYAESADVVRFLLRQEDRERFPALIARLREGQPFPLSLRDAYGLDLSTLEHEWREEVAKRYSFWPVFFSGSLVWAGVLVLFVVGWRRRRQRSLETLQRWALEEARTAPRRSRLRAVPPVPRVHIVLPGHEAAAPEERDEPDAAEATTLPLLPAAAMEVEVPKVQHDGNWHTLH